MGAPKLNHVGAEHGLERLLNRLLGVKSDHGIADASATGQKFAGGKVLLRRSQEQSVHRLARGLINHAPPDLHAMPSKVLCRVDAPTGRPPPANTPARRRARARVAMPDEVEPFRAPGFPRSAQSPGSRGLTHRALGRGHASQTAGFALRWVPPWPVWPRRQPRWWNQSIAFSDDFQG